MLINIVEQKWLSSKSFTEPWYLSKKLQMGLYHFQHVGGDLIQVFDAADTHRQQ